VPTVLAIFLLLAHLAVHEAGHAIALRSIGGQIREAGLGLPVGPRLRFRPTARRPWTFVLSPILLGAYVEPTPQSLELVRKARYRDAAWFAGAGISTNLTAGMGCIALYAILAGARWEAIVITVGVTAALWALRKPITWIGPLLGVALLGYLIVQLVTPSGGAVVAGPVGVVASATELSSFSHALIWGGLIGISMGLLNMLPIYPLDGGRIVEAALERRTKPGSVLTANYRFVSTLTLMVLIVVVITNDVVQLL
jgi:membrane-associated protease RseP (regulator of RpoE activity)